LDTKGRTDWFVAGLRFLVALLCSEIGVIPRRPVTADKVVKCRTIGSCYYLICPGCIWQMGPVYDLVIFILQTHFNAQNTSRALQDPCLDLIIATLSCLFAFCLPYTSAPNQVRTLGDRVQIYRVDFQPHGASPNFLPLWFQNELNRAVAVRLFCLATCLFLIDLSEIICAVFFDDCSGTFVRLVEFFSVPPVCIRRQFHTAAHIPPVREWQLEWRWLV